MVTVAMGLADGLVGVILLNGPPALAASVHLGVELMVEVNRSCLDGFQTLLN
jgi:hypothetical protein